MAVDNLKPLDEYPDISFIENYTIKRLETEMLEAFKQKKKELTGNEIVLASADERRLILQVCAYYIFQAYLFADDAGKMGLLKYSRGNYLENLGALKGISRKPAEKSTTTMLFSLTEPRGEATGIPQGTRATAGDGVFFETEEYAEIPSGETYIEAGAICSIAGKKGNEYDIGDIKTIVDPVPFVDKAENSTKPENGADEESDEALRQRIFIAPSGYSVAGPDGAYEYHARQYNAAITNVHITSPVPGEVKIYYLLENGEIPGTESLQGLQEYLYQSDIRPLTDNVEVLAPNVVNYDIAVTYYVNQSDLNRSNVIQERVNDAILDYEMWQRTQIGKDINPDVLTEKMIAAGAKRVEITSPQFTILSDNEVAGLGTKSVTYGGLEYD